MSFQPIVPMTGIAGWRFLERTYDKQMEAFSAAPTIDRDLTYFAEKIGSIRSAEALTSDYRLMKVALGAFGLSDDIANKYFIRRILEDGTKAEDALANRLADDRYRKLSDAFGFGPGTTPRTAEAGFAERIAERYRLESFEAAVGEQNASMRIALYAERALPDLAEGKSGDDTAWYAVMGDKPLRSFFETALGLPKAVGQIDIEQQLTIFRDRAAGQFGKSEVRDLVEPDVMHRLLNAYLARAQIAEGAASMSSGAIALTLLQGM